MKGKSVWFIVSCFACAVLLTVVLSGGFRPSQLHTGIFFLVMTLLCALLLLVWHRYVDVPTSDFLTAISRALSGDYQARFSCSEKNDNFKKLSYAFNQLMSCVENQTEELIQNRHYQNQLYENEKIYRSALELTCERLFEADLTHNRLIYGQEIYRSAFPFLNTEMFDDMVLSIAREAVYQEDADKYIQTFSRFSLLQTFRSTGKAEVDLDYRQQKPDGETFWVNTTVIFLSSSQDESLKIIGYVKNIDERKKQDLEILKQSQKDSLSGLYNKKFTQTLIESFLQHEGNAGRHAAIMLDIDNFKRINDTLGHAEGDFALMSIAQKLQGLFRSSDIVGRIGGDEFLILLKNYGSGEILVEKLQALTEIFREIRLEDSSYRVSGSVGVSLYPEDGDTYSELYKKSDIALYFSKAHGKDRFYIYSGRFGEQYGIAEDPELDESEYIPMETHRERIT